MRIIDNRPAADTSREFFIMLSEEELKTIYLAMSGDAADAIALEVQLGRALGYPIQPSKPL